MRCVLETERLKLRELSLDDLDFVAEMLADADVMRFYPKRHSREESAAWIQRQLDRYDRDGYLAAAVAIREMDFRDELEQISVPTLVIIGEKDPATIPEYGELIAASIPGALAFVVPNAAHLSNIEQPDIFTEALVDFLES